jgi:hypothetical protein
MSTAEPPTAPSAMALAFTRIAQLRAAGYDLVYPVLPHELARLRKGAELIIMSTGKEHAHGRS